MAINKNHEFEELDGVKCGIVEKNVSPQRVEFLKNLLQFNGYTVVAVPTPPPKVATPPPPKPVVLPVEGETTSVVPPEPEVLPVPPPPDTFTVGVTDITFNSINAVFGRLLKTPDKHIVTLAYWQQKENVANDEIPYFENKA